MIFDPVNAHHLKPWLVRTLEPICDAEPGALADYILALLKHNVPEPEMKKELETQLAEFLENECSSFIDTLFTALRSKSYLPYEPAPSTPTQSADDGIPIPLDGLLSSSTPALSSPEGSRKRSLENPDSGGRPSSKGPRLEGQFSRYPNGGGGPDSRSNGGWSNRGRPNGTGHLNGQSTYQPPDQRKICRDYYNLGYCSRGALCKYSHGDDALVPDQLYMNGAMPFMPMFGIGGIPAAAYDPRESRMDMRLMGNGRNSQTRPAVLPRMQQEEGSSRVVHGSNITGELPVIQDLTPEVLHSDVTPNPSAHSSSTTSQPNPAAHPLSSHAGVPHMLEPISDYSQNLDMNLTSSEPSQMGGWRGGRGGPRGAGRGRQAGAFNGDHASFQLEKRRDKTLVLEKIPEDKLSLASVNDWFQRFGTVTNVAIDQAQKKALVSFSTHDEAYAAWKSEDAVFNNRFVKVFWHRPMDGQGEVGRRALVASASLLTVKASTPSVPAETAPARKSSVSSTAATLAAKGQLLEEKIAEQKSLMASLPTASPEEKKKIMERFKQLDAEMKAATSSDSTKTSASDDKEKREKDRLDQELELHGTETNKNSEGGESTEDLKAKLERLKAEAASLGISDEPHSSYPTTSYRGYRGRGRGGRGSYSYFRGAPHRGGPPRVSMSLDNRPKRLLVKGISGDNEQALRDWYETTGQLESVTRNDTGDMIVTFNTRLAAEQGLAKGTSIPMIGSVQISWFTGAQPPASSATKSNSAETRSTNEEGSKIELDPEPESSSHSVDELEDVVASGWGRDDDGMGM
ncbi:hypothetical protein GYMLUDRAFT_33395 [Collybiopsis luxurians FD-317 M1]|nr:hypothetical protein GYMLUDRAFT_33395 [Collybiopsis luxurians FD-317 M1]